jgi:hypothetical protein
MGHFDSIGFSSLSEKAAFIESQFLESGINIPPSSRYEKYFECLSYLGKCSKREEYDKVLNKFGIELILQALHETMELLGVLNAFEKENNPENMKKFRNVLSGSLIPKGIERVSASRDILFEMNVAAHFFNANIQCELEEPDIIIYIDGTPLFIACKRPQGINNLENNIRKARRQIAKRGTGIIALSLDKIINPEVNILDSENINSLDRGIDSEIRKFFKEHKIDLYRWIKDDRKVIGIFCSLRLLGHLRKEDFFVSSQKMHLYNLCSETSPYIEILSKIHTMLDRAGAFKI